MTNEARELSINELDAVSGGDPKTVKIGPLTITVGTRLAVPESGAKSVKFDREAP